ncbi:adenosine kinase [Desulfobaculum xiamenense]|uniref:Adenosine kinase n=1 Tax=Desulfobaculum xiamenense TaxID=995050 RepID=A0A846QPN5_9BACT|nr:carbohydrate kinase family protein [Desulfobaculum xiamenense]NJB67375.1 adenosine kinase [Desulfobaculum xiamenense]
MQIYVFGSLAFDRIMTFPGRFSDHILPDKIHILNVCFVGNGLEERFGGTAGNIAYSLSLLGEKPVIVSTAGHRDFGRYGERFAGYGLRLDGVRLVDEALTASCHITTDLADNQITCFNPGAMGYPCGYDFADADPAQDIAIVAPGNHEDTIALPRRFREMGMRYIFDPGQNITALPGEKLLEAITGSWALISNDYELEMILRATDLSLEQLLTRTGSIITTLGDKGSIIREQNRVTEIPAASVTRVADPTGAGDAFRSGLLKGLAMGRELPEAAKIGACCATWCVAQTGTQEHVFTEDEFWEHYRKNFGPTA